MFEYYADGSRVQYAPSGLGDIVGDVSTVLGDLSNAGNTVKNITDMATYFKPFALVTVGLLIYIASSKK